MTVEEVLVRKREKERRWRERNPEAQKIKCKKWRAANQQRASEYRKAYRLNNTELDKRITKDWRTANMARVLMTNSRRRARVKGVGYEKVSPEDISNWDSRICGICKLPIEDKFHIDHIVPLSRGGNHCLVNLQLTHPVCNLRKQARLTEELAVVL